MSLHSRFTVILAAALTTVCLLAQSAPNLTQAQQDRLHQRLQEMRDKLQVTPEQVEKLRPVFTTEIGQFQDLFHKYGDPREASVVTKVRMRRASRSIQDQADTQLKQILSKQQMKNFQQLRDQWRAEWKQELQKNGWQG